jgi:hypothetical protein
VKSRPQHGQKSARWCLKWPRWCRKWLQWRNERDNISSTQILCNEAGMSYSITTSTCFVI